MCPYYTQTFYNKMLIYWTTALPSKTSSLRVRYTVLTVLYYLREPVHLSAIEQSLPPKSPRWAGGLLHKQLARPGQLGCFSPKSSSGPRGWGMSKNWPFCPYLEFLAHFLPKRRETLRIASLLLLSSLTRLEKNPMLTKNCPHSK